MIQLTSAAKRFGPKTLFEDFDWLVTPNERVGIVGASPQSWAATAHLPALAHLGEFTVTAVATTRQDSARMAAGTFGVRHAFASAEELAAHPDPRRLSYRGAR